MSTAVPQNLSQLKLEIYQLSQKKPFTKEDSSRAEILLKLLESRDDHQDSIRELKHRALAAEFPSGPSEFRMFLVGEYFCKIFIAIESNGMMLSSPVFCLGFLINHVPSESWVR